jgi:hypothetical protein
MRKMHWAAVALLAVGYGNGGCSCGESDTAPRSGGPRAGKGGSAGGASGGDAGADSGGTGGFAGKGRTPGQGGKGGGSTGKAGSSSSPGGQGGGAGTPPRPDTAGEGGEGGEPTAGQGGAGGEPAEDAPPTVSVTASSLLVTSAGQITLIATAADDLGIASVSFREGSAVLGTDATAPYEQVVAFAAADTGVHHFTAYAADTGSNVASAGVDVTVAIDADAPIFRRQLNGVRQTTPFASLYARSVAVDASGRPLVVTSAAQGEDDAWRFELTSGGSAVMGTGTSSANAYLHAAAALGGEEIAVLGSSDSCNCSSIVHLLLHTGDPNLGLLPRSSFPQSSYTDQALALTRDAGGNLYLAGHTRGTLPSQGATPHTNADAGTTSDAFLMKLDAAYAVQWVRQWGGSGAEVARSVALDAGGRVWVAGETGALGLEGKTPLGGLDAWVSVFDAEGTALMTDQFGSASDDRAVGVAAFAAGGAVVAAYGGAVAGATTTSGDALGGVDAFLRYYDAGLSTTSTLSLGTDGEDTLAGVAVGPGDTVWVSGTTAGAIAPNGGGGKDLFVRRYAGTTPAFTRQIGIATEESAQGIALDASGNAFVVGTTAGSLFATLEGSSDAVLFSLTPLGTYR